MADTIRPFRDSDVEVRREWYPVPRGTPTLGFPTAFGSAHWEPFPYLPRNVGEVFNAPIEFTDKPTPNGLTYEHFCGTQEDFQLGAVFNPDLTPRVYNADGIPECCMPTTCQCEQQTISLPSGSSPPITEITGSTVLWEGGGATLPVMRLPAREAATIDLLPFDAFAGSARLMPPLGERINGGAQNASIVIGPGTAFPGLLRATRFNQLGHGFPGPYWDVRVVGEVNTGQPGANVDLGATFTITAASGTWQNTGLTYQLPATGWYAITGQIRASLTPAAAGAHFISVRLIETGTATPVPNSESLILLTVVNGAIAQETAPLVILYNGTAGEILELQAVRSGTAFTTSTLPVDGNGRTRLTVTRLPSVV